MNDYRRDSHIHSTSFHNSTRDFSESAWRNIKPSKRRPAESKVPDPFWTILGTAVVIIIVLASVFRVL